MIDSAAAAAVAAAAAAAAAAGVRVRSPAWSVQHASAELRVWTQPWCVQV